ncbi:coiled-coil domain-containing protein 86 [Fimicolochytrium jonesii]|uniref:coiled-coil domain-containing protein 86 n=1 Tax=Fimicolochytrium jonesii TaxID=1396493 RepID=UPI0022FDE573|nr:coiled-coil domain-containing protein 86 [Fimicolochytrium jonesii]KAI8823950.1 coiled-coil domain-containing protein 86 [Fimicolochytrium jonesii]
MSADATVTIETIVPAVAAGSVRSGAAGVRGKPVSGRVWKTTQTKRHTSMKPRMLRQGWGKQIEERKQHQVMKAIEKELKDEKAAERQKQKDAEKERLKRKEENEKKAEVVQKVSAAKVKRMKKKQLRQLRKE